jgi:hypothetical protein
MDNNLIDLLERADELGKLLTAQYEKQYKKTFGKNINKGFTINISFINSGDKRFWSSIEGLRGESLESQMASTPEKAVEFLIQDLELVLFGRKQ